MTMNVDFPLMLESVQIKKKNSQKASSCPPKVVYIQKDFIQ